MHFLNRQKAIKKAKKVIRGNSNWKHSMQTLIKTRKPCSCPACSYSRKVYGITVQEKKADLEMQEQLR